MQVSTLNSQLVFRTPSARGTCQRTSSTKALRCLASTPSRRSSAEKLRASRMVLAGEWMSNCAGKCLSLAYMGLSHQETTLEW